MVRLLDALSVLILIAAGLLFTLCAIDWSSADTDLGQITTVSLAQSLERSRGGTQETRRAVSPLVEQAERFAAYLNPPAPAPAQEREDAVAKPAPKVAPANPSPKFELHGISYNRTRPEESMAMIWLPDGGQRWVRRGDQVGHFVIERIGGDSILYRSGDTTLEVALNLDARPQTLARESQDRRSRRQAERPESASPPPAPVRGILQMPPARVAARLGLKPNELDLDTQ
jgi:hypothetical protein